MRKVLFKYLLCCVLLSMQFFCLAQAQVKIDSLKNVIESTKEDTTKINALNELAWKYHNNGDYEKLYFYAKAAFEIAKQENFQNGIAASYINIGESFYHKGEYAHALEYYNKALAINKQVNDKKSIAATLGKIGSVCKQRGDYSKALKHCFEALEIGKELGDKNRIVSLLGIIGVVYNEQGDYPKALDYYFKALKMDEELGDKRGIAVNLGNIGIIYFQDDGRCHFYLLFLHIFSALWNSSRGFWGNRPVGNR